MRKTFLSIGKNYLSYRRMTGFTKKNLGNVSLGFLTVSVL